MTKSGRALSRQWTDKKPFSRRVRWYCAGLEPELRSINIRLEFEDNDGRCHKFYKSNVEAANTDWERFKQGVGTAQLRNERVDQRHLTHFVLEWHGEYARTFRK